MKGTQRSKSSRILSSVVVALFILSNVQIYGVGVREAEASGLVEIGSITEYKDDSTNASTIYFGSYWQDKNGQTTGDYKKDYTKSGIQWRVMERGTQTTEGAGKGVLLLSDEALYADQFNSQTASGHKWGTSEIRTTLNSGNGTRTAGTKGFANDAFGDAEYKAIASTSITEDGTTTTDRLFLLSRSQAEDASKYFKNDADARKSGATEFAQNVTMYGNQPDEWGDPATVSVDGGYCFWWLGSPGDNDNIACIVITQWRRVCLRRCGR